MPTDTAPKKRGRPPKPKTQSTAQAVDKAAVRKAVRSRAVSISDFSAMTGYDRNTISNWIKRGCPVEGRGGKGAILLDMRAVMDWREERARDEERAKLVRDDDINSADDEALKREFQILAIQTQQVLLAQKTSKLVRWQDAQMIFAKALNAIRQPIMNIAVTQERATAGWPQDMRATLKESTQDTCRETLKFAQQLLEGGLSALAEGRLAELNGNDDDDLEDEVLENAVKDAFDE